MRCVLLSFLLMAGVVDITEAADGNYTCGAGTVLDILDQQCVCDSKEPDDPNEIYIAGIFDTFTYSWGPDLFRLTVNLINEGWWGALASPDQKLTYDLANANCDATTAVRAYWDLRTKNDDKPMNGLVACRCSGASASLARTSGLEGVPQISPASNAARLSNVREFPYFSRVVSPNNKNGEVGAMIAMLREFKWTRVTIFNTDTEFSKDFATEFRKEWAGSHRDNTGNWFGTVVYSDTIRLRDDGNVDQESVDQVLEGIPTDDSKGNSRIYVLVAHGQHSFQILERATRHASSQADIVWVGTSSWRATKDAIGTSNGWLPSVPGYLVVAPYQNRNVHYFNFLAELQRFQRESSKTITEELPGFAAETVDAVVAMTKAISQTLPQNRHNGTAVVQQLRQLDFNGVSGRIQFTPEGDRKNPLFSIFNAKAGFEDGTVYWEDVGIAKPNGQVELFDGVQNICFASSCGKSKAVPDSSPVLRDKLPYWLWIIIGCLAVAALAFALKYWFSRRSKHRIKAELETFRDSLVGMRAAECNYIPMVMNGDVEQALDLTGTIAVPQMEAPEVIIWCWQETASMMHIQNDTNIYGDAADCWIRYNEESTGILEESYQAGKAKCCPSYGYSVDFLRMIQLKEATGFERKVMRVVENPVKADTASTDVVGQNEINLDLVERGEELPIDLLGEPQMVLVEGDIVQISKHHESESGTKWAFGSKLHHADEMKARQLVMVATGSPDGVVNDKSSVFTDSGWFSLESTRVPTTEDLETLQLDLGGTGALGAPDHWDDIADPTIVQQHEVKKGDLEYDAVVKAFMSTLKYPQFDKNVQVVKVERIQNLAMWQSYVVKRQTICYRETNGNTDEDVQRKALERFEKSWLWHGSNYDVVDKILQQGFNRSFAGKNATAYGKGVYFARDALYSAYPTYAVPDERGNQYMMACRVVTGEYCKGKPDALTPDIRCATSNSLYDSTVGLLCSDTMTNPSIYVTYHDAQAYPEYLIMFKTT